MSAARLDDFVGYLGQLNVAVRECTVPTLAPARVYELAADDWGRLAQAAKNWEFRWAAAWGEDQGEEIMLHAAFEKDGVYLLARTHVSRRTPVLPSHTPHYPAADRPERHVQDMLGVAFSDHPDPRRWSRHQAWSDAEYPLRKEFPATGTTTEPSPPDDSYRFLQAHGAGVYEIPVGPVHAGIIEPGHFRFQAVGEMVLNLEERLGYVHKGIEKIAEGRDVAALARLAGRVSGDSTVAHAWAACMAMERAAGLEIPPRGAHLRALMCERERVANHLGDIGAILNDVAFAFGFYQFGRLREQWTRLSHQSFGHRFMMDRVIPGGAATALSDQMATAMLAQIAAMRPEISKLMEIVYDNASVEDRLVNAGTLNPALAKEFGALGFVGRAASAPFDARRDAPYPPYDRLTVNVPVFHYGDVAARVRVRAEEIVASFDLIEQLLATMPSGPFNVDWKTPDPDAEGFGIVEGWRGEILTFVRFGADGRVARFFPRDPSWLTWPTLEKLIRDNIVPDFPVCNKSVNGSYSGHDL